MKLDITVPICNLYWSNQNEENKGRKGRASLLSSVDGAKRSAKLRVAHRRPNRVMHADDSCLPTATLLIITLVRNNTFNQRCRITDDP